MSTLWIFFSFRLSILVFRVNISFLFFSFVYVIMSHMFYVYMFLEMGLFFFAFGVSDGKCFVNVCYFPSGLFFLFFSFRVIGMGSEGVSRR